MRHLLLFSILGLSLLFGQVGRNTLQYEENLTNKMQRLLDTILGEKQAIIFFKIEVEEKEINRREYYLPGIPFKENYDDKTPITTIMRQTIHLKVNRNISNKQLNKVIDFIIDYTGFNKETGDIFDIDYIAFNHETKVEKAFKQQFGQINKKIVNNQEHLVTYVKKEILRNQISMEDKVARQLEKEANLTQKLINSFSSIFMSQQKEMGKIKTKDLIYFGLFLALVLSILLLVLVSATAKGMIKKILVTNKAKPAPDRAHFAFVTEKNILSLLSFLKKTEKETEFYQKIGVLLYFLPDKLGKVILEEFSDQNVLFTSLLENKFFSSEEIKKLESEIKQEIEISIDNKDILASILTNLNDDKKKNILVELQKNTESFINFISNFDDIFKLDEDAIASMFEYIPSEVIARSIITLSSGKQSRVLKNLEPNKKLLIKSVMRSLGKGEVTDHEIRIAREFIIKTANTNV